MQIARVKIKGTDINAVKSVVKKIKELSEKAGVKCRGEIYLPTKRIRIDTRKSMSGGGTETYEHWELRIYRCFLDVDSNANLLQRIMRLYLPKEVQGDADLSLEIKIINKEVRRRKRKKDSEENIEENMEAKVKHKEGKRKEINDREKKGEKKEMVKEKRRDKKEGKPHKKQQKKASEKREN